MLWKPITGQPQVGQGAVNLTRNALRVEVNPCGPKVVFGKLASASRDTVPEECQNKARAEGIGCILLGAWDDKSEILGKVGIPDNGGAACNPTALLRCRRTTRLTCV
jgi:hypothetical protein